MAAGIAAARRSSRDPQGEQVFTEEVAEMTTRNPSRSAGAERADWRDHAACRRLAPDLFFPVSTSGPSLPQVEAARRVCQRCPVLTPCLRWALDIGQVSGIWGGTTEEERRALRRVPAPR
jgi:WhiB family transcriptional regulator, redox-sensing transcriptional regulator